MIRTTKTLALVAGITATTLFVNSCKGPHDDVDLILNAGITESTVGVNFIDARTGEPIGMGLDGAAQVSVSIHGSGSGSVVATDGSGDYKCNQGFLSLALKRGVVPSETSPITFRVVASAPGYLKTSREITLYELTGSDLTIPMVKISDAPNGVAVNTSSFALSATNGTSTEVILNSGTPATNFQSGSARITIPAGTIMRDKDNAALSGTIATTLAYFNPLDPDATQAFPGGFSVETASNGSIVFTTGGFISLEMAKEGSNRAVKTFDTPITLTLEMPDGVLNDDDNPVNPGDQVPIWSYDTETGAWTLEGNAVAQLNGSGKIEVNYPVTHLSYWNIDWYRGSCTLGATINVSSNIECLGYKWVTIRTAQGQLISQGYQNMANGNTIRLIGAPTNKAIVVRVFENPNSLAPIGQLSIPNACSGTHNITVNSASTGAQVSLIVNLRCPDREQFIFRPTLPIWAREIPNGSWRYIGQIVNGNFATCALTVGSTYDFATFYNGQFYNSPQPFLINQSSYVFEQTLSSSACSGWQ